ncbi:hypothetical protein ZOSMA_54G00770 [Zostera marina]|uniref:E2F/DP family winged-helix DNA-binding domain-containing protein n=1 Tax=Zostera marina TaxID=29655 RepID=A0A0K9NWL4_ZOSMR|nr:hypothetical protein ZOSMA_54G00770 [Zostera marina]
MSMNEPPFFDELGYIAHNHAYSRKQKSLGLLCTKFLGLYNREGVECVSLDEAASRLGVERRRIYDIVNVVESVGVLSRKAKNRYSWIGFKGIPKALASLKEEAKRETSNNSGNIAFSYGKNLDDDDDDKLIDHDAETVDDTLTLSIKTTPSPNVPVKVRPGMYFIILLSLTIFTLKASLLLCASSMKYEV